MRILTLTRLQTAIILPLLMLLLLAFACTPSTPLPATAISSETISLTAIPTKTPLPTATLQPSATPVPTATTTPLVPGLGQVIYSEDFDDTKFYFHVYGPYRIESGAVVLEREPSFTPEPDMPITGGIYGINSPYALSVTGLSSRKAA